MARSQLSKAYLYGLTKGWVELPEDPTGDAPLFSQQAYEALGYYPKPALFGEYPSGAYVEVYTQSADSDDAPYTFLCRVGLAGTQQNVFIENLPSLISLLKEMGPAIQAWDPANQPP
jgi:hypothetical protein